MNIETADRLLRLRKQHGLSQEDLAVKLNISRQAVSKWERAEAAPDTDNLIELSKLYNVSLDELLTGLKTSQPETERFENEEPPQDEPYSNYKAEFEYEQNEKNGEDGEEDDDGDCERDNNYEPKVSFNGGIFIRDGQDKVDISPKGIFVENKNGAKVDISLKGIHVNDPNGNHEFVNGHFYENGRERKISILYKFPFYIIAIFGFLYFGFALDGWRYSWLSFLTIPLYYSGVSAIVNRNISHFAYPVLTAIVFFSLGIFRDMWHPGWMIFFTIPIYYWFAGLLKRHRRIY